MTYGTAIYDYKIRMRKKKCKYDFEELRKFGCGGCGKMIEVGQSYHDGGESFKWHTDCAEKLKKGEQVLWKIK